MSFYLSGERGCKSNGEESRKGNEEVLVVLHGERWKVVSLLTSVL